MSTRRLPLPVDPHAKRFDPIAYAWRLCNPRVPLPNVLRRDAAGVLSRPA